MLSLFLLFALMIGAIVYVATPKTGWFRRLGAAMGVFMMLVVLATLWLLKSGEQARAESKTSPPNSKPLKD
ncbi:MAG: hypothetical protein AB1515_01735 [Nitrospirota bacterium]